MWAQSKFGPSQEIELIQLGNPSRNGIENPLRPTCGSNHERRLAWSSSAAKVKIPTFPISLGQAWHSY
jgi:hypothetical protein